MVLISNILQIIRTNQREALEILPQKHMVKYFRITGDGTTLSGGREFTILKVHAQNGLEQVNKGTLLQVPLL